MFDDPALRPEKTLYPPVPRGPAGQTRWIAHLWRTVFEHIYLFLCFKRKKTRRLKFNYFMN